ncbi:MAG: bifunctional phosphopantothenoylcysteine decarboxylase/phosphopantothenate--cysteine ligase CoaBC [Gemmatimonadaceae bacterium]|nr:bifunctional phosphopantothenoylcysteine decarboxylase/phosphopantothenate--cysteine ligase CoaBC [Gemmatimonadaceae bacterium]
MRPFDGRRVLLGVTGGIAAYKTAALARDLTLAGAEVDVVLTRSARAFVGAITFEALTGRPVHSELVAEGHALDHIRLPRAAQVIVVAPATADFLARAAAGRADDLLAASLLAAGETPVLIVPAMNDRMWAHPQTVQNTQRLRDIGYHVLEPDTGLLASREEGSGPGRMPEPAAILAHIGRLLEPRNALQGRHVVVTAGPTREALDPVRYLSNHSSGKMGVAIAAAAWRRGADVTLIAGPMAAAAPMGPRHVAVETTEQMAAAVREALAAADVLVMAAAPADFRPRDFAAQKIKKGASAPAIALEFTTDILKSTRDSRPAGCVVVGFALETQDLEAGARKKLAAKECDLIVANRVEEGAGFGTDTNRVILLGRDGAREELPLLPKSDVADALLDRVAGLVDGR